MVSTVRVLKFGGSSVSNAARMQHIASIIKTYLAKGIRPIVVLSAMGKTTSNLIACAKTALAGNDADMSDIERLHVKTLQELGLDGATKSTVLDLLGHCQNILKGVTLVGELSPGTQDVIMSFGERLSVRILAAYLCQEGVSAKAFDAFDIGVRVKGRTHGSCEQERIGAELTDGSFDVIAAALLPEVQQDVVPIITGFIAKNEDKRITTLGRGGSDLSASLIGSAILASSVEIWTDTNGILTGDPSIVDRPSSIPQLTFEQASELAQFGAKVLHPRTIEPAMQVGVPVVVRNSFNIEHPGTTISDKTPPADPTHLLVALTLKSPVILVDIKATYMLGQYGFLAKVFSVFEQFRISVDVIATSEISISITLDKDTELSRVEGIKQALRDVADVKILGERSIIALIGDKSHPCDILELACGTLKRCETQIEMVSLGASKLNTSLVVAKEDGPKAVQALHQAFFFPREMS